jgi:hypothetical protein
MRTSETTLLVDTLARCRQRGEELIGRIEAGDDHEELARWRERRDAWVKQTTAVLNVVDGDGAAAAFRAAVTSSVRTPRRPGISGELLALRASLEVLERAATHRGAPAP